MSSARSDGLEIRPVEQTPGVGAFAVAPPVQPQSTASKQRRKKRGMGPTRRLKKLMRNIDEPVPRPARYLRDDYPTDSFLIAAGSVDFKRTAEQLEEDLSKGKIERYPRNQRKANKKSSAASTVTWTEEGYPTSYEDTESFVTHSITVSERHPQRGSTAAQNSVGQIDQPKKPSGSMLNMRENDGVVLTREERERQERLQLLITPDALANKLALKVASQVANPSKSMLPPPQSFTRTKLERKVLAKFDRVAQDVARAELEKRHAREEAENKAKVLAAQATRKAAREEEEKKARSAAGAPAAATGNKLAGPAFFKKAGRKMSLVAALSPPKDKETKQALKVEHKKRLAASTTADRTKSLDVTKRKRGEAAQQKELSPQEPKRSSFLPEKRTDIRRLAKQWLKPIFAAIATERLRKLHSKFTPVSVAQFKYSFCLRKAEEMVRFAARRRQGILDNADRFTITVWLTLRLKQWKQRHADKKYNEGADQIVKFLDDCAACRSGFTRMMVEYRKRVVRCQRIVKSFLLLRRTRCRVLSMMWQQTEKEMAKEHNDGIRNGTIPGYFSLRSTMPRDKRERCVRRLMEMATIKHLHDRGVYYNSLANQVSLYERSNVNDVKALMEAEDPSKIPVLVIDEKYKQPPIFLFYTFLAKEIHASLRIFWAKKDEIAKVMQRAHDEILIDKAADVLNTYKKGKSEFSKLQMEVEKAIDKGTFGRFDIGESTV